VEFVADDLRVWLVGWLADAARRKLTTLVLGRDQEWALLQAATAAVQRTPRQLRPGDGERAEELMVVISQVFGEPIPDAPTVGNNLRPPVQHKKRGLGLATALRRDRDQG
jgi:hypothetical protein